MSLKAKERLQDNLSKTESTVMKVNYPIVIFINFLILKLTDNIDWSWWWVTSPLWIPLALILIGSFLTGFVNGITNRENK